MNLVTGSNGLVGSHLLVELARRGNSSRALLRKMENNLLIRDLFQFYFPEDFEDKLRLVEFVEGDILDIPSLETCFEGVDTVYHAAAVVSFRKKDRDILRKVNIEGTTNVVNCCLDTGKTLGFISSTAALGRSKTEERVDENTRWKNSGKNSFYAISKFCAEREVWRGIEEGLQGVIVNPAIILGPGDYTRSSGKLFSTINRGIKFYTEGINGYVDVRDVANTLIILTDKKIFSERFVLSAENRSYREVFSFIAEGLDKPAPHIKAGKGLLRLAVWAAWLKSLLTGTNPTVTRETANNALNSTYYSSARLKTVLDVEFIPVKESVLHTSKHFLERHSG